MAYDTENIHHFNPFISRSIPVIFFDRISDQTEYPAIYIDNYKTAYDATAHLIKQGCKQVVHIGGNQLRNVYSDRFKGYLDALKNHQLEFDESMLIINNLSTADCLEAAKKIVAMPVRPDGVFAANDSCAVGCMLEMKKQGLKIPEDMAFVGFNNDPMCCVIEPNLTTINYKGYEMGGVAARVLIGYLTSQVDIKNTHSIIIRSELIVRESSVKNKAKKK